MQIWQVGCSFCLNNFAQSLLRYHVNVRQWEWLLATNYEVKLTLVLARSGNLMNTALEVNRFMQIWQIWIDNWYDDCLSLSSDLMLNNFCMHVQCSTQVKCCLFLFDQLCRGCSKPQDLLFFIPRPWCCKIFCINLKVDREKIYLTTIVFIWTMMVKIILVMMMVIMMYF